jgi:hypothetical protein
MYPTVDIKEESNHPLGTAKSVIDLERSDHQGTRRGTGKGGSASEAEPSPFRFHAEIRKIRNESSQRASGRVPIFRK